MRSGRAWRTAQARAASEIAIAHMMYNVQTARRYLQALIKALDEGLKDFGDTKDGKRGKD